MDNSRFLSYLGLLSVAFIAIGTSVAEGNCGKVFLQSIYTFRGLYFYSINAFEFYNYTDQGKCGSFASQQFNKRCSGTEVYLGKDFSWTECENKCAQYASNHGVGCCEGRAESWGKCAYYVGGSEIEGNDDSKSVQCSPHQGKNRFEFF